MNKRRNRKKFQVSSDYVFVYYNKSAHDFSNSGNDLFKCFKSIPAFGLYNEEKLKADISNKILYVEDQLIYDLNTRVMESDGKYYFYQAKTEQILSKE